MAGDRRAALILQASQEGLIDFSKFDPYDRNWWLKLKWTLDGLIRDNLAKVLSHRHNQLVSVLGYTEPQIHQKAWSEATTVFKQLADIYFPWAVQGKTGPRADFEELRKTYVGAIGGDLSNPEIKKKVARTVQYLEQQRVTKGRQARRGKKK